ncbi:hypothetical protein FHT10_002638 [Xanthomonas arboricola]|nr:hypothetical protein [Xanthomonas cannabis]
MHPWFGGERRANVPDGTVGLKGRESGIGNRESGIGNRESGVRSRESGVGSRESGIGSRESGVGSRESGIGSRESGVGSRESGVGSQESGVRSQESGVGNGEAKISASLVPVGAGNRMSQIRIGTAGHVHFSPAGEAATSGCGEHGSSQFSNPEPIRRACVSLPGRSCLRLLRKQQRNWRCSCAMRATKSSRQRHSVR